jgi:protein CpxP
MKKSIILAAFAVLIGVFSAQAQGGNGGGGGFQRRTVEERVKSVMEKLGDLKLDKDQTTKADSAFSEFYRAQDKARQEAMAGGGQPDREKMREVRQKLEADRDEKLKKIFSEAQFKKWKDEIEATTRPQRGGGVGNRNGGGGNN